MYIQASLIKNGVYPPFPDDYDGDLALLREHAATTPADAWIDDAVYTVGTAGPGGETNYLACDKELSAHLQAHGAVLSRSWGRYDVVIVR